MLRQNFPALDKSRCTENFIIFTVIFIMPYIGRLRLSWKIFYGIIVIRPHHSWDGKGGG